MFKGRFTRILYGFVCVAFSCLIITPVQASSTTPESYVDHVLANHYPPEQVLPIYRSFSPAEQKRVWQYFVKRVGEYPGPKTQAEMVTDVSTWQSRTDAMLLSACDPGAAPYCWRQGIEEKTPPYTGAAGVYNYITTTNTCDTDPDIDYVFVFLYNSSDPDRLRWSASSNQVILVLSAISPINSYGYNNNEVRMCVGDNTVYYAGGANNIKQSLKVSTRP